MKKIIAFILFSQLFLLTACENTTIFSGESKDLKNKYVSSDNDQSGDFDLVIMYIGKEPAPAKINYEYSLANKFNRKAENLELKDNKVQFEKVACDDCGITEDSTISFGIQYNNKSEIIELEPK
ncbi:MAG: hypothetical protein ACRC0Q_08935 [Kurthia gibsonii]|uniref:hypothetical protein n=1 Tax=Kurthia gibsonii TaxID=33946 RepID=UPI0034CD2568